MPSEMIRCSGDDAGRGQRATVGDHERQRATAPQKKQKCHIPECSNKAKSLGDEEGGSPASRSGKRIVESCKAQLEEIK